VIGIVCIASISSADVTAGWYQCTVRAAGPAGTNQNVYIVLKDRGGSFYQYFYAETGREKEMLGVALTAISTGFGVQIYTDGVGTYPIIRTMFLQTQ